MMLVSFVVDLPVRLLRLSNGSDDEKVATSVCM
jgi:hypothetical protein